MKESGKSEKILRCPRRKKRRPAGKAVSLEAGGKASVAGGTVRSHENYQKRADQLMRQMVRYGYLEEPEERRELEMTPLDGPGAPNVWHGISG